MITAIIVDDEKAGRETLYLLLKKYFANRIYVLQSFSNVKDTVSFMQEKEPDVVFLDIEMPEENGLNLSNYFEQKSFEIIVTTAHEKYGINAIKSGVFDYLLKPIDMEELEIAISKVEARVLAKREDYVLKNLLKKGESTSPTFNKIPLLISNNKTIFVDAKNIIRCEAEGNYTKIFFIEGKTELITKLMKDVEELLHKENFFRVHKSHLINLDYVKALLKSDDAITMVDDSAIPLSRNIKSDFLKKMNL